MTSITFCFVELLKTLFYKIVIQYKKTSNFKESNMEFLLSISPKDCKLT